MIILDSARPLGVELEFLAEQARIADQMNDLVAISKQIEEWNSLSSIARGGARNGYSASVFKREHDRILEQIAKLWSRLRELQATGGLAPWIFYQALYLRRRASCPMMRFKVSMRQALAHSIPATFLVLGKRTRRLFVAHPPIAPPFAA